MPTFIRQWLLFVCILFAGPAAFAQVTLVASTSLTSSNNQNSMNPLKPSSNTDHLLVAMVTSARPLSFIPSGWTQVQGASDSSNTMSSYVLYKWVAASDPSSYMFNFNGGGAISITISAYAGVDSDNPVLASSLRPGNPAALNTTPVNISMRGSIAITMFSRTGTTSNVNNNQPTTPAGTTSITRAAIGSGNAWLHYSYSYEQLSSPNSSYSPSSTPSGNYIGILLVLRPEVTPTDLGSCVSNVLTSPGPLNPAQWRTNVVGGTFTPQIVAVNGSNRLRMTEAVSNQSTLAQLQRRFPGAGNRIVVEFDYYTYGGDGADGLTVVFSDATVLPTAGAFGGSLGYAQAGTSGFAGGWLAVGLDEYGNFPNPNEGRTGYPSGWTAPPGASAGSGFYANNVSVRGSGSGSTGYRLLANSGTLGTPIWRNTNTSSSVQRFRILIDHSDNVHAYVRVERDRTGTGNSYSTVIPKFDAKATNSGQTAVPTNWIISFTGSTGGQRNIHEIGGLGICADTVKPVYGEDVSDVSCLESSANKPWVSTARQPLYTKVSNQSFTLDAVTLKDDNTIENNYVQSGFTRYLQMELFPRNSTTSCAAYTSPVASSILTLVNSDQGRKTSGNITVPSAQSDMICRVRECVDGTCANYTEQAPACSTDRFTVRPPALTVASTANADATGLSATATPIVKAGAAFTLTANTSIVGYTGIPVADSTYTEWLNAPAGGITTANKGTGNLAGNFTTGASASTGNGAVGTNFTYDDVGYFRFQAGGVRDATWATGSNDAANNDCIVGSASNTLAGGKYGCDIINQTATSHFGRFVPDRLTVVTSALLLRTDMCPAGCDAFQYMDEPMAGVFTLNAVNSLGNITKNYSGAFAKYDISMANIGNLGLAGITPLGTAGPSFSPGNRVSVSSITGSWSGGAAPGIRVNYTPQSKMSGTTKIPDGPYDVAWGIKPVDTDGITLATAALNLDTDATPGADRYRIGTTTTRFGKLVLTNAAGSNLRPLTVAITAKYWNGTSWVVNTDDNNTKIPLNSIGFGRYSGGMNASQTNIDGSKSVLTLNGGAGSIVLTPPTGGFRGSFDVGINLSNKNGTNLGKWSGPGMNPGAGDAPTGAANLGYLSNDALGSAYDTDPAARVTFGVYKTSDRVIDTREQY